MRIRSISSIVLICLVGCGEPDVRTYHPPKPHIVPGFEPETPESEYRILGAMFPADEPVWFIKVIGSAKTIATFEPEFDAFLKSVTFPDGTGKPPKWVVPEAVKSGPPRDFRFATLIYTVNGKPLELVVSDAKGGLAANITRWAGQVGIATPNLGEVTKPITAGPVQGLKVSLAGPQNPNGSPGMMAPR